MNDEIMLKEMSKQKHKIEILEDFMDTQEMTLEELNENQKKYGKDLEEYLQKRQQQDIDTAINIFTSINKIMGV